MSIKSGQVSLFVHFGFKYIVDAESFFIFIQQKDLAIISTDNINDRQIIKYVYLPSILGLVNALNIIIITPTKPTFPFILPAHNLL